VETFVEKYTIEVFSAERIKVQDYRAILVSCALVLIAFVGEGDNT